MMKKQSGKILLAVSMCALTWSCDQKDPAPKGNYVQGVFVINEGNFQSNNGSLSFFKREETTAQADIFQAVNGSKLQGGVQGYTVAGESGLILVDNDQAGQDQVQIVNSNTFEKITAIGAPDIENPRKVVAVSNNKAYVSCWGGNADFAYKNGYIAVIDLTSNRVVNKINLDGGPENLVFNNGKLFVGTTTFTNGRTLTVINTATDQILKSVTFSGTPVPIGLDADGKLWVNAGLEVVKLNPDTYAVEKTLTITSDASKSAASFALSNDRKTIYFVLAYYDADYTMLGQTYKFGIADTQISTSTPFINRVFTGLTTDPSQGLIYAGVTPNYGQAGYAVRYRTDGTVVDSIKVGIAPTGFFFR